MIGLKYEPYRAPFTLYGVFAEALMRTYYPDETEDISEFIVSMVYDDKNGIYLKEYDAWGWLYKMILIEGTMLMFDAIKQAIANPSTFINITDIPRLNLPIGILTANLTKGE